MWGLEAGRENRACVSELFLRLLALAAWIGGPNYALKLWFGCGESCAAIGPGVWAAEGPNGKAV